MGRMPLTLPIATLPKLINFLLVKFLRAAVPFPMTGPISPRYYHFGAFTSTMVRISTVTAPSVRR